MLCFSAGELQFRMELDEIQRYVMSYVLKARSMPYSGVFPLERQLQFGLIVLA